jgi:hypothetical protein
VGVLLFCGSGQHLLHDDLVVGKGLVDGGALEVGCGVGLEALQNLHVLGLFFQRPYQAAEVVLHIFFYPQVLLLLLFLDYFPLPFLLLYRCVRFELEFHLCFLHDQVEHGGGELLDEGFVEFEFLRVVDFVEFYEEVVVEVEENGDAVDDLFDYFKGALCLHDGGFSEGLFEVVNDLIVTFLGLLHVFAQSRFVHNVTSQN